VRFTGMVSSRLHKTESSHLKHALKNTTTPTEELEILIKDVNNLMGCANVKVNEPVELMPGLYEFPFEFNVPFQLLAPSIDVCSTKH
jgi:hypothetical protein